MQPIKTFAVSPVLPDNIASLKELAYNYWWSWDEDGRELFSRVDRVLWEETRHNPVKLLNNVSQARLLSLSQNSNFVKFTEHVYQKFNDYLTGDTWYNSQALPADNTIVYFCAEFGIHESFPNYSGGLGVLAGDHLKSASDLGLPLVGMGLLYQQGYFHQYLTQNGWQNESYIDNDFSSIALSLITDGFGNPVIIDVDLPNGKAYAQIWKVDIGRICLYLLDSNIDLNTNPEYRKITDQLYGGNHETRILQEIMLGMGGFRALKALNLAPDVCHLNEGHAAFSALERIRTLMHDKGLDFYSALEIARAGNVFTTHTPVPAGNEVFSLELIQRYFQSYCDSVGIGINEFFALGRQNPADNDEEFSMTVLGLRLTAYHNGVSKLHGITAQRMWHSLWKDFPVEEVPISAVPNGVHTLTWVSRDMAELYDRYLTPRWRTETSDPEVWQEVQSIPNEELWRTHDRRRERLVILARRHLRDKLKRFATPEQIEKIKDVLNPDTFTIGFARRFATYKRATLLFGDMERLARLINNATMPVQMVLAGKAHPHDTPGKEMIKNIVEKVKDYDLERSIVFLEDYDMAVARYMVKGCDIWLNTPRRPLEASGTSGMKSVLNGGVQVSTLDGWWEEAYNRKNGFAIGSGEVYSSLEEHDFLEREALFTLLEQEIVPMFYTRSRNNVPEGWVERMKESIRSVACYFSTARMVQQYCREFYVPAINTVNRLSDHNGSSARELLSWKQHVRAAWDGIRIQEVTVEGHSGAYVGKPIFVSARVALGDLRPQDVAVEAYYGSVNSRGEISNGKTIQLSLSGNNGDSYKYEGSYTCESSGMQGCTARVVPTNTLMTRNSDMFLCSWARNGNNHG